MRVLSALILVPAAAALLMLMIPASKVAIFRNTALGATIVQGILLFVAWSRFIPDQAAIQLSEHYSWFSVTLREGVSVKADYFLGADGMSAALIGLTVVVMIITVISSFKIDQKVRSYFILLMLLDAAIVGAFSALDFLLFFLFFEFMLLPLYFLVGIWGGPRREYAAVKFFLYTFFGSILILIGIIMIHISMKSPESTGITHTFNILHLQELSNIISGSLMDVSGAQSWGPFSARMWVFLLLFVGFAIKLPAVPFHTWLPDAHVEAPTPVSVVLAALVLKVGGYGIIRFAIPIFPMEAVAVSEMIALMAVVTIIYGALNAMASRDLKRLIAYSSVSHMGFVLLGVASMNETGISGAVFQMVSHGILTTLLFLLAGVLYDRTSDRLIANYSGLSGKMSHFSTIVLLSFVASLGLPVFSGFIGELLVLTGAFDQSGATDFVPQWMAFAATFGLLIGAGYFLWTYQRMFMGTFGTKDPAAANLLTDLNAREKLMLIPMIFLTTFLGILPQSLLRYLNPFGHTWVQHVLQFVTGS